MLRIALVNLASLWFPAGVCAQQTFVLTVGYDFKAQEAGKHGQYAHDARDMKAVLEAKSAYPVAAAYCMAGKKADLATVNEKLDLIR